jgi:hypothetical protein
MGSKHKRKKNYVSAEQHVAAQPKVVQQVAEIPPEQLPQVRSTLMERILTKINQLAPWQVAVILTVVGLCVFATGLSNPFQGDDITQIVNNPPVHSISHLLIFFESGTAYAGHGLALGGTYYRPLMVTMFSLIYTVFGAHTFPYHFVQILIVIASAIILYLVFERLFRPLLALTLALIFLVHPMNSQVAFAIPTLQDALYFFFGILSFYLLISIDNKVHVLQRRLWLVVGCLFMSLLSKEAGGLFIAVDVLYLYFTNKYYLKKFWLFLIAPVIVYLALKINAVGLSSKSSLAPLDKMGLGARLLTAPSIMLFYLSKFIFPLKLSSGYFWAYSSFSYQHTVLPLVIDLAVVGLVVYLARVVKQRRSQQDYRNFIFFALWAGLGIVVFLQIFPMDFTASETWFYFGMVGLLGMIGVLMLTFQEYMRPGIFITIVAVIICLLGVRTIMRGTEWSSEYNLAIHDIAASKEDYEAMNNLSDYYYTQRHDYPEAEHYALASVKSMPTASNYSNLAVILQALRQDAASYNAFLQSLHYGVIDTPIGNKTIDQFSLLLATYGNYRTNQQYIQQFIKIYPTDAKLWEYLAALDQQHNNNAAAKTDIIQASHYGTVSQGLYEFIMTNGSCKLTCSSTD